MLLFYVILYVLVVAVIKIAVLVTLMPLILGTAMIIIGNVSYRKKRDCFPVVWNFFAVIATLVSSIMLWVDIGSDSVDCGALPFVIIILFALFSLVFWIPASKKDKRFARLSDKKAKRKFQSAIYKRNRSFHRKDDNF